MVDSANPARLGPAVTALLADRGPLPRLLGFGEPLHFDDTIPRLRNDLLLHLVEHAGFGAIALESCCLRGRLVDAYVRGGDGGEADVLARGFSHRFGTVAANRDLLRRLRDHNAGRAPADQVRFFGFDPPLETMFADSPRGALTLAYASIGDALGPDALPLPWDRVDALLGDDARWTAAAAAYDPARSCGGSAEARELGRIADGLRELLAAESGRFAAATTPDGRADADLAVRTAVVLLEYHAMMADGPGDGGGERDTARWNRMARLRDTTMADNLVAIAGRTVGPTLVFAHDQHLHTGTTPMALGPMDLTWPAAGEVLRDRLGDAYAVVGTAIGTAPHLGLGPPEPDTVEGVLAAAIAADGPGGREGSDGPDGGGGWANVPADPVLVPAVRLAAVTAAHDGPLRTRTSANFAYLPLGPEQLGGLDALLFLPDLPWLSPSR